MFGGNVLGGCCASEGCDPKNFDTVTVYKTSNQWVGSGAWSVIDWEAFVIEDPNIAGAMSLVNDEFTAPIDGWYDHYYFIWTTFKQGPQVWNQMDIGGAGYGYIWPHFENEGVLSTEYTRNTFAAPILDIYMAAGDKIRLVAFNSWGGGNVVAQSRWTIRHRVY